MAEKRIVRADKRSRWDDVVNRIVDRDKGSFGDVVLWRHTAPSWLLDADNTSGDHANFGDVLQVRDSGISMSTDLAMRSGSGIAFSNAADSNAVVVEHSGVNDLLGVNGGLWVKGPLNVGTTLSTPGADGVVKATTFDSVVSGGLFRHTAASSGTNNAVVLGTGSASDANAHFAITAAGSLGWGPGGAARDTVLARTGVGALTLTGGMTATGQLATTVAAPTAPLSVGANITKVANLNADLLDDRTLAEIIGAPLQSVLGSNYSLTTTPTALPSVSVSLAVGNYVVFGMFDFLCQHAGDVGHTLAGKIVVASGTATISNPTSLAALVPKAANDRLLVFQVWPVSVTVAATINAQAYKSGGTGTPTSLAVATNTHLTALFAGRP